MAATPVIYDLRNDADAARFGLSPKERDRYMGGCFPNRSGRRPQAVFCHVQEGTTKSSLRWAIEKPGGQNSYSATAQLDGSILLCIPEEDGPWTNGAVRSPKPKARKLLDLGGNPNLYTLSIEAEGFSSGPHPQVQIDAIYWLILHWAEKYDIPVSGDDGAGDWLFEHADVDTEQRANCAGPYYDTIQRMVREGVGAPPPTYAKARPIPELEAISGGNGLAPAVVVVNDTSWIWVGDRIETIRATPRFQHALKNAAHIGPLIPNGTAVDVDWMVWSAGEWWYYRRFGTRIRVADTRRISDSKGVAA